MATQQYSITGMACSACVNRVRTALAPFADSIEVTLKPPEVILTNANAELATLNATLSKIGHYVLSQK